MVVMPVMTPIAGGPPATAPHAAALPEAGRERKFAIVLLHGRSSLVYERVSARWAASATNQSKSRQPPARRVAVGPRSHKEGRRVTRELLARVRRQAG